MILINILLTVAFIILIVGLSTDVNHKNHKK